MGFCILCQCLYLNKCVCVCEQVGQRSGSESWLMAEVHGSPRVGENHCSQQRTDRSNATICSRGVQSLTVWSCLHSPQHRETEETTEREGGAGEAL